MDDGDDFQGEYGYEEDVEEEPIEDQEMEQGEDAEGGVQFLDASVFLCFCCCLELKEVVLIGK